MIKGCCGLRSSECRLNVYTSCLRIDNRALKTKLIKKFKYGVDKNYDNMTQMIIVDHLTTYDYFQFIAKCS